MRYRTGRIIPVVVVVVAVVMIVSIGAIVVTYVSVAIVITASATATSVNISATTVSIAVPTGGCRIVQVDGSVSDGGAGECFGRMSTTIISVKRTTF